MPLYDFTIMGIAIGLLASFVFYVLNTPSIRNAAKKAFDPETSIDEVCSYIRDFIL
jgi:hypothetical protein